MGGETLFQRSENVPGEAILEIVTIVDKFRGRNLGFMHQVHFINTAEAHDFPSGLESRWGKLVAVILAGDAAADKAPELKTTQCLIGVGVHHRKLAHNGVPRDSFRQEPLIRLGRLVEPPFVRLVYSLKEVFLKERVAQPPTSQGLGHKAALRRADQGYEKNDRGT